MSYESMLSDTLSDNTRQIGQIVHSSNPLPPHPSFSIPPPLYTSFFRHKFRTNCMRST